MGAASFGVCVPRWPAPPRPPCAKTVQTTARKRAAAAMRFFNFMFLLLSWTLSVESILEQLAHTRIFYGPRIVIWILGSKLRSAIESVRGHADVFQSERRAQPVREIVHALRCV